jgi:hypothetical protein
MRLWFSSSFWALPCGLVDRDSLWELYHAVIAAGAPDVAAREAMVVVFIDRITPLR